MPIRLPKTLSIPPSLKPKPPRIQIRTLHFQGRFSSARMLPLQDRLENPVHPALRIFQIANQYHTLNQFRIMLRFLPSEKTGPFPLPALRLQPIAALASETLDQALREQLERELALLERGENIAPNQRRKRMLQKQLGRKPAAVIRRFYSAQMQVLAPAASETPAEEPGFFPDIIQEKIKEVREFHTEQLLPLPADSRLEPDGISPRQTDRIAEQVFRKLEQKLKIQKHRNGLW